MDSWNSAVDQSREMVEMQNKQLKEKHDAGELSAEALVQALEALPEALKKPDEKWCRNFSKRFGWHLLSPSTEQASLPYDHPDMQQYRQRYQEMVRSGVNPDLILNFDQVWRTAFSWSGRLQWKPRGKVGMVAKKGKVPKRLDKKRHAVRGARKSLTVPRPQYLTNVG